MKVEIKQELEINHCNDCPFGKCHEDTSCCLDSFDSPDYDYYCTHKDVGLKFITSIPTRFRKCDIPDWCPFKKTNN